MAVFGFTVCESPPTGVFYTPGSQIKLNWKIRNSGTINWPHTTTLFRTIGVENPQLNLVIEMSKRNLCVGESCTLTIDITVPNETVTFGYKLSSNDEYQLVSSTMLVFTVPVKTKDGIGPELGKDDRIAEKIAKNVIRHAQTSSHEYASILIQVNL